MKGLLWAMESGKVLDNEKESEAVLEVEGRASWKREQHRGSRKNKGKSGPGVP